jgi:hypothetical protein
MKNNPKGQKKGNDAKANDDTLGENTEQTPLAKEVKKEQKGKEKKKSQN